MKTTMFAVLLGGFFLSLSAAPLKAQSLADLARQERAKHGSQTKAVKVYTNDNIPKATTIETSGGASTAAPASTAETPATGTSTGSSAPGPSTPSGTAASGEEAAPGAAPEKKPEDKKKTKEYWQAQFQEAQANLDRAEEELSLANDELTLSQMNQARELDPQKKAQLDEVVTSKLSAADSKRTAEEKAKKALEDLKARFQASGAPEDWLPKEEKK
jgi:hypothetical protein